MSIVAIQKELKRVRGLKNAYQAEAERLRSDMEQGRIRFRVDSNPVFRQKLAEAITFELNSSQPQQKQYFADPVSGEIFCWQPESPEPWSDENDWRILPVRWFLPKDFKGGDILNSISDELVFEVVLA